MATSASSTMAAAPDARADPTSSTRGRGGGGAGAPVKISRLVDVVEAAVMSAAPDRSTEGSTQLEPARLVAARRADSWVDKPGSRATVGCGGGAPGEKRSSGGPLRGHRACRATCRRRVAGVVDRGLRRDLGQGGEVADGGRRRGGPLQCVPVPGIVGHARSPAGRLEQRYYHRQR